MQNLNVAPHSARDIITNIFPENIAKSVAENEVLQVVIFSVLFGLALAMVPEVRRRPLLSFAESLADTMFKFTNLVMLLAPIAVFGAIAYTVGHLGLDVLLPLLKLLATMYVALTVFIFGVLLPIALFVRVPMQAVPACGGRASDNRVRHGELGSRAPEGDGRDGATRCPSRHGGIRPAHRL